LAFILIAITAVGYLTKNRPEGVRKMSAENLHLLALIFCSLAILLAVQAIRMTGGSLSAKNKELSTIRISKWFTVLVVTSALLALSALILISYPLENYY